MRRLLLKFNILINYGVFCLTGDIVFTIFKISINSFKIIRILEFIDAYRVDIRDLYFEYLLFKDIVFR